MIQLKNINLHEWTDEDRLRAFCEVIMDDLPEEAYQELYKILVQFSEMYKNPSESIEKDDFSNEMWPINLEKKILCSESIEVNITNLPRQTPQFYIEIDTEENE